VRVVVAGATGVIGGHLVPLLVDTGHEVVGMTRTPSKARWLESVGAGAVVCDVFDSDAVHDALVAARPDVVLDELTDLPDDLDALPGGASANARIRRIGTRHLLDAAQAAGAHRFVVQSIAWQAVGDGGAAVAEMEAMVLGASETHGIVGLVIRYGRFYGPGTFYPHDDALPPAPHIHIEDAARLTLPALAPDLPSTILTLVDPD
jgi:nucleoside-diphosphate-sugar epimerase